MRTLSSSAADAAVLDRLRRLSEAAALPSQPAVLFAAVDEALATAVGRRMTTVMRFLPQTMELERLYSNQPGAYPMGARKSKRGLPWADQVLLAGLPFVGRAPADLRWAFDDADKLLALGLGAVINQPIVWNGAVLGTLNVLDAEGCYGEAWRQPLVRLFADSLRAPLLEIRHQPSA